MGTVAAGALAGLPGKDGGPVPNMGAWAAGAHCCAGACCRCCCAGGGTACGTGCGCGHGAATGAGAAAAFLLARAACFLRLNSSSFRRPASTLLVAARAPLTGRGRPVAPLEAGGTSAGAGPPLAVGAGVPSLSSPNRKAAGSSTAAGALNANAGGPLATVNPLIASRPGCQRVPSVSVAAGRENSEHVPTPKCGAPNGAGAACSVPQDRKSVV